MTGRKRIVFIGWFGPRGLASIVFAIIVFHEGLPESRTLVLVVVCTVILSIVAHGMSANPIVTALGAKLGKDSRENSSK